MRTSWDQYFIDIAKTVATRSTCKRKNVGCVLVRDNRILGTGYNGSMRSQPHCTDVGCLMEDGHCVRTIHSEVNAVATAARNGVNIDGSTAYITASPCWSCFKTLINSGVNRVIFLEFYKDERIFDAAKELGIELLHLEVHKNES